MRNIKSGLIRLFTASWLRVLGIMFVLSLAGVVGAEEAAEQAPNEGADWTQNQYIMLGVLLGVGIVAGALVSVILAMFVRIAGGIVLQERVSYGTGYKVALKAMLIAVVLGLVFAFLFNLLGYKSAFPYTYAEILNVEAAVFALVILILTTIHTLRKGLHVSFGVGLKVWFVLWLTKVVIALAIFGAVVGIIMIRDLGGDKFNISKLGIEMLELPAGWTGSRRKAEEPPPEKEEGILQAIMKLKATPTPGPAPAADEDTTAGAVPEDGSTTESLEGTESAAPGDTPPAAPTPSSELSDNAPASPQPPTASTPATAATPSARPRRRPPTRRETPADDAKAGRVVIKEETFSSYKTPGSPQTPAPTP